MSRNLLLLLLSALLFACASGPLPRDPTAALLEAEALIADGKLDAAVDAYLAAARDSQDPSLIARAVAVTVAAGRGKDSRALVDRWVQVAPDDTTAHARRALLAFDDRELDVAIASLARIEALAGASAAAGLLMDGAPAARAQRVLVAHAAAFPDDKLAWLALGTVALRAADLTTASAAVARARALDGAWPDAVLLEARISVRRDRDVAALAELDRLALAPGTRPALRLVAALLRAECGDLKGARAAIARQIAADPGAVDARLAFATVAIEQGDRDAAAEMLRPAAAETERDDVRLELGRIAEQQGATADAILWYREVVSDDYATASAAGIARVLTKSEGIESGRKFLQAAREGQPAWGSRLTRVEVELLRSAGDDRAARELLDDAIRAEPDPDLRYQRALVAADTDDVATAERDLRALLKRTPDDPSLQNALGYTLTDARRKLDEAERLLTEALAAAPDEPAILDSFGWLKYRRGDATAARGFLERAKFYDDDAEICAHLGEVLWTLGDQAGARKVWDEATAKDPADRVLVATRQRFIR